MAVSKDKIFGNMLGVWCIWLVCVLYYKEKDY